jgi:hypothetical protein
MSLNSATRVYQQRANNALEQKPNSTFPVILSSATFMQMRNTSSENPSHYDFALLISIKLKRGDDVH